MTDLVSTDRTSFDKHSYFVKDKSVIILGGSGSIGAALAEKLSSHGARVVLVSRNTEALKALSEKLGCTSYTADATQFDQVETVFQKTLEHFGQVDAAINCVGSILLKPAHRTTQTEWEQVLHTNLTTSFALVRSAAQAMQKSGGAIALCASAAAQVGLVNHEAIAAAKAGVIGLMRAAAATYASKGIRINCISPGLVETGLSASLIATPAGRTASLNMHPLKRLGTVEDISHALFWLIDSSQSSWITGQVLGVDGGLASIKSIS